MLPPSVPAPSVDSLVAPLLSLLHDATCAEPVLLGGMRRADSLAIQVIPLDRADPLTDLAGMVAPAEWDLAVVRLPGGEIAAGRVPLVAAITRSDGLACTLDERSAAISEGAVGAQLRRALAALFAGAGPRRSTGPARS